MIAALSRTRSYLRMLESEFGGDGTRPDHADQDRVIQETLDANPPPPIQIWTEQWVYVKQGSRAKQLISDVAELLDEAILLAKTTNLPRIKRR